MSLADLRRQMATTGRVEIARDRGRSVVRLVACLALSVLGVGCLVGGANSDDVGLGLAGFVVLAIGVVLTVQTIPGARGQTGVVVDGAGISIGARLAPWSQIASVNLQTIRSRAIYGSRSRVVTLADAAGRSPFHAPDTPGPSWPWAGQAVPQLLEASQLDVAVFLQEQLLAAHSSSRTTSPPPPPLTDRTPPTDTPEGAPS